VPLLFAAGHRSISHDQSTLMIVRTERGDRHGARVDAHDLPSSGASVSAAPASSFSEIFRRRRPIARMATMLGDTASSSAVPEIFHELEPRDTVLAYGHPRNRGGNRHKDEEPIAAFDDDGERSSIN